MSSPMTKEKEANTLNNANGNNLPAPPGFASLTSFSLKRSRETQENGNAKDFSDASKEDPMQMDAATGMSNNAILETCLRKRPWILFDRTNYESEESDSEQSENNKDFPSRTCLPKGVSYGCPDCGDCLKVTARWRPEDARKDVIEEAPVFYPTEEEFKDTLKYIAKIRPRAESYGICRISPPPSWNPPCVIKEEGIWENSKFFSQVQRIDGLQIPNSKCKSSFVGDTNGKRRRTLGMGWDSNYGNEHTANLGETGFFDTEDFESVRGPEFTMKSFKRYADDFKGQYFDKSEVTNSNDCSTMCHEKWEPSIENIEGEYKRIVDTPTEEIEVLCSDGSSTGDFSSGFPTMSKSSHPEIVNSGWNLNNVPRLFGSLLSLESCDASRILAPQVQIGMCFSTRHWRVEEHYLYSLCYLHLGAPKIWYAVPQKDSLKFQLALKNSSADLLQKQHKPVKYLSPSSLKSEGIPVFRCVQKPREFLLVFPGAYHLGFDCGFNCSETANFAPLDWLPHGESAVQLYRDLGRKTSLSHDKLLLRAAFEAVRAQWELSLCRKSTSENLFWKDACGREGEGILSKAFKSRVKSEEMARKFLCSSSRTQTMDEKFNAIGKRECKICLYDLHFSAAGCPCSADVYSCLNHAKQLCSSCPWTDKFFLFRHEISDLNLLVEALEGKLTSVFKWGRAKLGLSLNPISRRNSQPSIKEDRPFTHADKLEQKEQKSQSQAAHNSTSSSVSNLRAELKARLLKSIVSNKSKAKDNLTESLTSTMPIGSGRNLASCISEDMEARVSESTKIPNRLELKQKTVAPAVSSSIDKDCSETPIGSGKNLASCVNKDMEACVSESTIISNPLEPKQKTLASAASSSRDKACSETPSCSGEILASCINKDAEAHVSESTKISNRLEPKQRMLAPAAGSSIDRDCSFPKMEEALGVLFGSLSEISSDESDGDESDTDPVLVFQF